MTRSLLLGKRFGKGRHWAFYSLEIAWQEKSAPIAGMPGMLEAREISVTVLPEEEVLKIFRNVDGVLDEMSPRGFVVARHVLASICLALRDGVSVVRDRANSMDRRRVKIAGMLARTGYDTFLDEDE